MEPQRRSLLNAGKGEDAPMVDGQLKLLADGIFHRADHTYSTSTVYVVE